MEYTTNQKGLITEMEVALHLIKLGYQVSQPLNADSRYDFIVDTGKKLLRIQVKTAHLSVKTAESIQFKCRSITGRGAIQGIKSSIYSTDDVDYFATYWDGQVYLVPVSECSADKTLHLKKEKIRSNFAYAEDYIASEVLKAL